MKNKHLGRILLALGVFALSIYTLWPTYQVLSKPQDYDKPIYEQRRANYIKEHPYIASKAMQLGLDLAGGTHIVVEIDLKKLEDDHKSDVLDRCLEILRNRVDQFGLSEPILSKSGDNRIVAELAGVDAEAARRLIGATALLEFKLLGEMSDLSSTLERIDHQLSAKGVTTTDTSAQALSFLPASPESPFGRVVDGKKISAPADTNSSNEEISKNTLDTALKNLSSANSDSSKNSLGDSLTDTSTKLAASKDNLKNRPFTSLLVGVPGGIAVKVENLTKVRQILNRHDVKNLIPSKYQLLFGKEEIDLKPGKARELFFVKHRAEMTGEFVSDARVQRGSAGEVEVGMDFKGKGPREFGRITGANIQKRLAIVLDSVVYSAPTIQGKITQGKASITGIGDFKEAKLLATTLRAGSLPAPMSIVELRNVGPSMGSENISSGLNSAVMGFLLVIIFMLLYYRVSGFVAIIALFFNVAIIFALLSLMHATLTLPGIAGIILTIGMAVDANVIIYERIREELAAKKSLRASIEGGYKRAFSAIFDSNITTIATALILYKIGTGPIKGFGLTLVIGIAASMFTAIWLTRLIFDLWLEKTQAKTLSLGNGLKIFEGATFDWIGRTKLWVTISLALFVVPLVLALAFGRFNFGIDFTGGHVYQIKMPQKPVISQLHESVKKAGVEDARIQNFGAEDLNEVLISVEKTQNAPALLESIKTAVAPGVVLGEETVGPRIGNELKWKATLSIFLALLAVILYIWFRFGRSGLGFGLGAVVAVFHDVLIVFAIYALMGLEIDLTFIAAILTIIGYSINDSIVIFDRVRENQEIITKGTFASRCNLAINQSLARTTITGGTTLLVVLCLIIMGGDGVASFAWAMLIGVIVGTYSSNCIASPFVVWWHNRYGVSLPAPKKEK